MKALIMNVRSAVAHKSVALGVAATAVMPAAFAGTTGAEFGGLYNLILGWTEGLLGRTLAIAAFLIGALVGFAKSTAMPALIGIVFAILFAIGPGVINGIATALV